MGNTEMVNSTKQYDVIVVGAGPAGCSTATFASKQGLEVLLLDKARFPRDKVCGDGITPIAMTVLDRMGVAGKVEDYNPVKSDAVVAVSPNGTMLKSRIPHVDGLRDCGYVFPRKDFDHILFNHAMRSGNVEVLESCRIKDLVVDSGRFCGVRCQHRNQTREFYGKYIVAADGPYSVIARKLNLYNDQPKHRAFAVRAYYEDVEGLDSSIGLYYDKEIMPGYGWIFPVGKRKANVGAGIVTRFRTSKNIKELFKAFVENNRYARKMLKNARMVDGSLMGWPLPFGSFESKRSMDNVLLTGDAGSFVDPLTGEGIYYALRSGEFAVMAIADGIENQKKPQRASKTYERLWRKEFRRKEFKTGYRLQTILGNNTVMDKLIKFTGKKARRAMVLAGVIEHKIPKRRLFFNL